MKVLLCGTYPNISTGYSKVVSQICKHIGKHEDIDLYVYGIQKGADDVRSLDFGSHVHLYDATSNEKKPSDGFGMFELADYIVKVNPDIVFLYNDLYVMTHWYENIKDVMEGRKLVIYLDLFYKKFYSRYIPFLQDTVDHIFVFSEYWETYLVDELKITTPVTILYHGFSSDIYKPLDQVECRKKFGFDQDTFIVLNLNRNLPRKRIDIFMMAVARLIYRNPDSTILVLQNSNKEEFFDIYDILTNEFRAYGMTQEEIEKHLDKVKRNFTSLPDETINELYNAADIGVNTCGGEGWGLCNFEQLGIGKPQIATVVGGMADFLNNDYSIRINPVASICLDPVSRDSIGGNEFIVSHVHVADAMEFYMNNPAIRQLHGQRGMKAITGNPKYTWEHICNVLHDTLLAVR